MGGNFCLRLGTRVPDSRPVQRRGEAPEGRAKGEDVGLGMATAWGSLSQLESEETVYRRTLCSQARCEEPRHEGKAEFKPP